MMPGAFNLAWLLFGVPALVILGFAGWAGWYVYKSDRVGKLEYAQQSPLWQSAMYKWEQLYYCGRDDVVFTLVGPITVLRRT